MVFGSSYRFPLTRSHLPIMPDDPRVVFVHETGENREEQGAKLRGAERPFVNQEQVIANKEEKGMVI